MANNEGRLPKLGLKPNHITAEEHFTPWFADIIGHLLNATDFLVNGTPYRFAELEAYYHGPGHLDLFAHRDPLQRENGRWYFHRTRGEYRSGSFKGLDLALGDGISHFGILIRSILDSSGKLIYGPSLTVDHLLSQTKVKDVASLDEMISGRPVWDTSSPLAIRESPTTRTANVYSSSRVGLSLKKAREMQEAPRFVARPYRFLTEPQAISKGKPHLVLSLYRLGQTPEAIHQITGCAKKTIERYIADYGVGRATLGFEEYTGKALSTADLCKLLGTLAAKYGS